jgi:hypothetical protein
LLHLTYREAARRDLPKRKRRSGSRLSGSADETGAAVDLAPKLLAAALPLAVLETRTV